MKKVKEILIIFLTGIGLHKLIYDVLKYFDQEYVFTEDSGYFSILAFLVIYLIIKSAQQKESYQTNDRG
jgi:hypothetical protein